MYFALGLQRNLLDSFGYSVGLIPAFSWPLTCMCLASSETDSVGSFELRALDPGLYFVTSSDVLAAFGVNKHVSVHVVGPYRACALRILCRPGCAFFGLRDLVCKVSAVSFCWCVLLVVCLV